MFLPFRKVSIGLQPSPPATRKLPGSSVLPLKTALGWPPRRLRLPQDNPRWSQNVSKTAPDAPKTAQDGPRGPKRPPRRPKMPPRKPQGRPGMGMSKGPREPSLQDGPQDAHKSPPRSPRRGLRRPKGAPGRANKPPKRPQNDPRDSQDGSGGGAALVWPCSPRSGVYQM